MVTQKTKTINNPITIARRGLEKPKRIALAGSDGDEIIQLNTSSELSIKNEL